MNASATFGYLCAMSLAAFERANTVDDAFESQLARNVFDDPDQFLQLYNAYYNRILNYLYRRSGNRELALDLTSRTFLSAFEALRKRPYTNLQVRAWLYRLATNAHLDHCRGHQRWLVRIPTLANIRHQSHAPTPATALFQQSEAQRIRSAIDHLSQDFRTAILLRYDEELSFADIARTTGTLEVTARSRVNRALKKLAQLLDEKP